MTDVWAVIPTQGRPVFREAIKAAADQCARVIVVSNGGFEMDETSGVTVVPDSGPVNIHRWWNTGLDLVPDDAHALVINDDCILGPGAVGRLVESLERTESELVYPYYGGRFAGWCWLMAAGSVLRADEDFVWWYGDDDLVRRARNPLSVMWVNLEHRYPNVMTNTTPALEAQTAVDAETYRAKWG